MIVVSGELKMKRYLVTYRDDEGCKGQALVSSNAQLNSNEITDALEKQLRENDIDAKVIYLDVEETNLFTGIAKYFVRCRA